MKNKGKHEGKGMVRRGQERERERKGKKERGSGREGGGER